jgi:hypothetical protein
MEDSALIRSQVVLRLVAALPVMRLRARGR